MDQRADVDHLKQMPVRVFPRIGTWDGVVMASPVGVALLVALWRSHDTWVSGAGSFSERWTDFWSDMSSWRMRLLSLWARSSYMRLGLRFAMPLDVARHAHELGRELPAIESWQFVELVVNEVRPWFIRWEREMVDRECLLNEWSRLWPEGVAAWPSVFEGLAEGWLASSQSVDQLDQEVQQAVRTLLPLTSEKGVSVPDADALLWSFRSVTARLVRERERRVLLLEPGMDETHLMQPLGV